MFDHMMICDDGMENVVECGSVVGFAFYARLPYYRGLGLSMVEDVSLFVDGEAIERQNLSVSLKGRVWSLDEMENAVDARWNFGEKARIVARQSGGLSIGPHEVELSERLRISYLPFAPTTTARKTLNVAY